MSAWLLSKYLHRQILALVVAAALVLSILSAGPAVAQTRDAPPVRIGVLAYLGADAATNEWAPLIGQLSVTLPTHRFELVHLDHGGMRELAARGELDFIITNPGHYVELEAELGASRILTLASGPGLDPSRALGSAVIVRKDSTDIQRLEDLRGKRVAVVSREGFGGYQLVWRELSAQGIRSEDSFGELRSVGFPMDRVFDAVLSGEVDAGIVRACLLETRHDAGDLRVVDARTEAGFACATSTRLYPDWPIAILRHTPQELARAVAIALLSPPLAPGSLGWAVPADYQSVHELFRELQIGPYAYLREPTLMALAERYWPWVAVVMTMLIAWVLYTVRVEHLVHSRTAALRDALAEREALAIRMREHQEQADHLARLSMLGELSGTLAHELNQPLATIGNYAQSLVRRAHAGRLTEDATCEAAAEIATQAERAAAIIGRIRSFAKKRVQRESRAPFEIVNEAVALFRGMLAHAPEVEVVDRLAAGTTIEADALQIQQVLLNLLKNGYDASHELDPTRRTMRITLTRAIDVVRISVRDFGPGLDPAISSRLFEPFLTTKPDGLGLGLSICTTIAEAHGGRLSATAADDGPGMVFTLAIPDHD